MSAPAADVKCRACDDTGRVLSISGELRPCSRCNAEAWCAWADARKPALKADPKPTETSDD